MGCNGFTDLLWPKDQSITKVQNYLASDSTQTPPAGPVQVRPVVGTSPVLSSDIITIQAELNEPNVLNDVDLLDYKDSMWDQKGERERWEAKVRDVKQEASLEKNKLDTANASLAFEDFRLSIGRWNPLFDSVLQPARGKNCWEMLLATWEQLHSILFFCGSCQSAFAQWQGEHHL